MKGKKKSCRRAGLIGLVLIVLAAPLPAGAYADVPNYSSYIYTQHGEDVVIPDVYTFRQSFLLRDAQGKDAEEPQDMALCADGSIAVADTGNDRILLLDTAGAVTAWETFVLPDGSVTTLSGPEGISAGDDGTLLIADTQNGRILRCDSTGQVQQVFDRPANMLGVAEDEPYLPTKVAQDSYGRLYIVARNINRGIICVDPEGLFVGYVGAPRVVPDVLELLWRRISTKAQKEQMTQYVSTEYNNVLVDSQNFIWGTISALDADEVKNAVRSQDTSGQVTPVAKINAGDSDVLKRNGSYAPLGDLRFEEDPSRIVDVAVQEGGMYSLLDFQRGRVFTYDNNGELLYVFGGLGDEKADLHAPSALLYRGNELCVLDRMQGCILTYQPTAYGLLVQEAVTAQFDGDFDRSYQLWSQVAESNSNFEYAFIGMGNVCVSNKDYRTAMEYFRYANDMQSYSDTFERLRKQQMSTAFSAIFFGIGALLVLWLLSKLVRRFVRYVKGEDSK